MNSKEIAARHIINVLSEHPITEEAIKQITGQKKVGERTVAKTEKAVAKVVEGREKILKSIAARAEKKNKKSGDKATGKTKDGQGSKAPAGKKAAVKKAAGKKSGSKQKAVA